MKINSNIQALFAQTILAHNEEKFGKSTQKLSSGYTINRAMDNPAGMAISNRMRARLQSLERSNKNAKNAVNTVQTAEGGMAEIGDMLQRMNELAVQASNGTMTDTDRSAIQEEINQLSDEISRISKNTTYNTQTLLDGSQALKGYVTNDSLTYAVRSHNENFEDGKYKASFSLSYGADAEVTPSIKLVNTDTGSDIDVAIKSTDTKVFYDDYDKPTKVTGVSMRLSLTGGGEITLDAKINSENEIKAGVTTSTWDIEFETKSYGGMKIQTGAEEGQEVQLVIPEISLKTLNFIDLDGKRTLDMSTEESSRRSLSQISKAIDYVAAARSKVGAYQNRIENTISNLDVSIENLTESYSTIKDLDMAEGMVEYTTLQVLIQAGNSMLAQANEQPQQALQLLQ